MASLEMLNRYDHIPDALLTCNVRDVYKLLGGPSLFYLQGRRGPPLFVTVLQHGNEPTGFDAIQSILRRYQGKQLPRSMWLFIANVEAASEGLRVKDGQADYNRVWPGTELAGPEEVSLMQQVVSTVTASPLFASVDLHNNTGCNPHYGCINELKIPFLHLASLFARTTVFFQQPVGVQSLAMARHCPAITLECGQAGENAALEHAVEFLEACLHLHHLPEHAPSPHDINLLHTVATAKMRPGVTFGFDDTGVDVVFRSDLDHFNFGVLEKGSVLGQLSQRYHEKNMLPFTVCNDAGEDIGAKLFAIKNNQMIARHDIVPSMATLDIDVIRQDCLFYVMEQIDLPTL